jgi:hypothetical protein
MLTACAGLNRTQAAGADLDRLQGIWEVCFTVREQQDTLQAPRFSNGYIALTRMDQPSRPWMYLGDPTHYGVYTADLTRIGIGRDPRIPLPLVGARATSDSIHLVLDPFGSHGPVVVRGQLGRGAAAGTWFHQSYALGAEGTFSMRRVETSTLPVPYPVGGPLTPPAVAGCL